MSKVTSKGAGELVTYNLSECPQGMLLPFTDTPAFVSAFPAPAAPFNAPEEMAFYPTAKTIEERVKELLAE